MIPEFPAFKPIELRDQKEVESVTSQFLPYSDFNFVSMWAWNLQNETCFSRLHNNLVVKLTDYVTQLPFYTFIGNTHIQETTATVLKHSINTGCIPALRLLPEEVTSELDPGTFSAVEDRDNFDYVYSVAEQFELPGGKFAKKRNHINNFISSFPNVTAVTISIRESSHAVKELLDRIHTNKTQSGEESGYDEARVFERLLTGEAQFNLISTGIFLENQLIAVLINELIDAEYALGHLMAANTSISGSLYAFLMHKNAEILLRNNITLLNFEQDLGLENLRIAKSRFRPVQYLKKYTVSYST